MLTEIEGVCDDVVILNLGQIVARGSVAEVIGKVEKNMLLRNTLRLRVPAASETNTRQLLQGMSLVKGVTALGEMEGWLLVELQDTANGDSSKIYQANNQILSELIRAKIPILSFEAAGGRLQDVFLHLTEETIE
jgi:ABC-2 type transport system ATP-binding protein